ncbi:hypothetical protein CP533_0436 [Ophiocordyceps camponoti-saundersi (nom. inval.)]|nr:hypothetical protein CP533_0436 [Ophiocordyceps camponoti-saundersi (nom. inval.)]
MSYREWNWDIDRHLNRFVPPPPWHLIPFPLARFLGHRRDKASPSTGNIVAMIWAFFGILVTISLIEGAMMSVPSFIANDGPIIVGSLGASAVLEFLVIDSPLAQPRNAVGGHIIATIVGVSISKLFQLNGNFHDIRWLGGAFACAAATVIMALTKTVHPPAGATALTAVVDSKLVALGWLLVPAVMVGSLLMLGMSLLVNNIDRRFPLFWWTASDLGPASATVPGDSQQQQQRQFKVDMEKGVSKSKEFAVKIKSDVARNCIGINPCQQDTTIIRDEEIKQNLVNECGRTEIDGNIDVGASTEKALASNAVTQVQSGSQIQVTLHQVNADGAGPYVCDLDENSNSGIISPKNVTMLTNVPGDNGLSLTKTTQFNVTIQMPDDLQCTGASTGNICTVRCRNTAAAGPFGGCFAVQQVDITPKVNTPANIKTVQPLDLFLSQIDTNRANFDAATEDNAQKQAAQAADKAPNKAANKAGGPNLQRLARRVLFRA